MWLWIGLLAGAVAVLWLALALRRRISVLARRRCPDCGGHLRSYEQSPTCPHCFAILDEVDQDEDGDDEPGSVDEIDEDYEEPERW